MNRLITIFACVLMFGLCACSTQAHIHPDHQEYLEEMDEIAAL